MSKILSEDWVKGFVKNLSGGTLRMYHVKSLANAVYGALESSRLSISSIGRSFAQSTDRCEKHGIKQVDRLVGTDKVNMEELFRELCHRVVEKRKEILVSLDWTEYDYTDQSRVTINMITSHGRATPLVWLTAVKSEMKSRRSKYEKKVLRLLKASVPEGTKVIVTADRGFSSIDLFAYMKERLGWHYITRTKENVEVYDDAHTLGRKIKELRLVRGSAPRVLRGVHLTKKKYPLPALVAVWDRGMKEPWYLATSLNCLPEWVVAYYGRRFTCEEQYRDEKDDRFGAGSKEIKVGTIGRRNMLTMIHAIATIILTFIGAAGERIGYDRKLRANTEKRRTHSLYRQGKEYIAGVQTAFLGSFRSTIKRLIFEHAQLTELLGVI